MSAYVEPGTRWEDKDHREKGRLLEVTRCTRGDAPIVYLKTVESQKAGARATTCMRADTLRRRFREVPGEQAGGGGE